MLLFDLNGVLLDVEEPTCTAIKKTAEFFLGRVLDNNIIECSPGNGLDECYDACEKIILNNGGYAIRKHAIAKKFQEYYQGRNFNGYILEEKPLVDEKLLKTLKGYTLAIATERGDKEAEFCLEKAGVLPYFKHIVSYNKQEAEDPPASYIEKSIRKLKATKASTLFIAAHPFGLQVSQEAAIPYVAITNGNKEQKQFMKEAGAFAVMNHIKHLKKVI